MALGTSDILTGQTKVSAAEAAEFEQLLSAKRTTEIPTNLQLRADYLARTDGLPTYMGYAPKGLASSSTGWLLQKFTYDASSQCTLRQIAYNSWDLRADVGTTYS